MPNVLTTGQSFFSNTLSGIASWIRRHWKLITVVILIAAGLGYWQYRRIQANQPDYNFEHPIRQDIVQTLEVTGVVDAKEKARLRFIAGGKVTYVGAKEGDAVTKWQTIATIDQATLQKQLEQDLNDFMKERLDWDKTITYDQPTGPTDRVENWTRQKEQLNLTNEVLDVEIRDIAIRNTRLTAPFDGVLTASPTNVAGVQLLSSDYFEVINPETLIIRAEVDEADISRVELGQPVQVTLDAYPNQTIDTQVEYIAFTSSESSSGTVFMVEMRVPNPDLSTYRLGMNGDVSIQTGVKRDVLTIPFIATRVRDDRILVDVKTGDNQVEEREIEVGLETDELVEVVAGLDSSDQIVVPE